MIPTPEYVEPSYSHLNCNIDGQSDIDPPLPPPHPLILPFSDNDDIEDNVHDSLGTISEVEESIDDGEANVIDDDTPPPKPPPHRNPSCVSAGAGVPRIQMSMNNSKAYDTARMFQSDFQAFQLDKMDKAITKCNYQHHFQYLMLDTNEESATPTTTYSTNTMLHHAIDFLFTQYGQMSAKKGIEQFGEETIAALIKEYKQLDQGAFPGKPVVAAAIYADSTDEQKIKALETVNLIKRK